MVKLTVIFQLEAQCLTEHGLSINVGLQLDKEQKEECEKGRVERFTKTHNLVAETSFLRIAVYNKDFGSKRARGREAQEGEKE